MIHRQIRGRPSDLRGRKIDCRGKGVTWPQVENISGHQKVQEAEKGFSPGAFPRKHSPV